MCCSVADPGNHATSVTLLCHIPRYSVGTLPQSAAVRSRHRLVVAMNHTRLLLLNFNTDGKGLRPETWAEAKDDDEDQRGRRVEEEYKKNKK